MSFDAKTGHFILTISKARLAFQIQEGDTDAIAARLRERGIMVHEVCPAWVRCDMRPGQIWKAFHDQQPDPSDMAFYWTQTAAELYPEWAAEELSEMQQAQPPLRS